VLTCIDILGVSQLQSVNVNSLPKCLLLFTAALKVRILMALLNMNKHQYFTTVTSLITVTRELFQYHTQTSQVSLYWLVELTRIFSQVDRVAV